MKSALASLASSTASESQGLRPTTRVLLWGAFLTVVVLVVAAALAWGGLVQTVERERQRLELLASVLQTQASQVFEAGNLALDNLAASLQGNPQALSLLPAQQAYYLQSLPFLRGLALVNAEGFVLISTTAAEEGKRLDLQRLTRTPVVGEGMVVGLPVAGRSLLPLAGTGVPPEAEYVIPLVRRVSLTARDHVLLVALLNPQSLAQQQVQLRDMGASDTQVLLLDREGGMLSAPGVSAQEVAALSARLPLLPDAVQGSYGPQVLWQPSPLGAWQRAASQPLVTLVQQPYEVGWQRWRTQMRLPWAFTLLALVVIAVMTASAWRNARARQRVRSERDEARQAMAEREQELSLLFASVQDLLFRTDASGCISLVNARWSELTGQSAELARGRYLRDVVHADGRDAVAALFAPQAQHSVRTAQARLSDPQGRVRTLDITVVPLSTDGQRLLGFAGSAVDVSALLAAQQQLQEQLTYSHQLLEATPLPVGVLDAQGRFVSVNRAWEDFMGLTRQQVLGQSNREFLTPAQAQVWDAHNEELLRGTSSVSYQERVQQRDGRWRDVQVTKVLLQPGQGLPTGMLVVKMDVTELLAAHQMAAQASSAKSEFVANISHELRTPLQSILGFSELGMARGRGNEKLVAMFTDIHSAGERMLALVNDLLDLAKIESTVGAFAFERHDVRDIIEDVVAEFGPQLDSKRLKLALQLGRMPLVAKLDPARFSQVVRNVLANAVKFSPSQGTVRISASAPHEDRIEITLRDQGPGIPSAELESVFQAFVQSSQTRSGAGGTGLGLAICQKIITAHGGRIFATNATEGGAVFHIHLPSAGYTDTMPGELR